MFKRRKLSLSDVEDGLNDENHVCDASSSPEVIYRPITRATSSVSSTQDFISLGVNNEKIKAPPDHHFKRSTRELKGEIDKISPKNAAKPMRNKKELNSDSSKHKVWSYLERNIFFEALQEHGRDFESIANYLMKRSTQKTKQQVRCFFYNTWQRVCKYIDGIHEDRFDLPFQLYGMINYGEYRRKLGSKIDEKRRRRFNELVHQGSATVKVGKRFVRLTTPVCEALKRINHVKDKTDKIPQVPQKVTLEFRPKNTAAWTYVQDLAQNPRIRVTVQTSERLSSIIAYLIKKWQPKYHNDNKSNSIPNEASKSELKLYPPDGCEMFAYDLEAQTTSPITKLSLEEYLNKVTNKRRGKLKNSKSNKDCVTDESNSTDNIRQTSSDFIQKVLAFIKDKKPCDVQAHGKSPLHIENASNDKLNSDNSAESHNNINHGKFNHLPNADDDICSNSHEEKGKKSSNTYQILEEFREVLPTFGRTIVCTTPNSKSESSKDNEPHVSKNPELEKFREGWTYASASEMTVAEIYLLLRGSDGKCCLEYDWTHVSNEQNELEKKFTNLLRRLSFLASTEFACNYDGNVNSLSPSTHPKSPATNGALFSPGISSTPKANQKVKSRGCGNLAPKTLQLSSPIVHNAIDGANSNLLQNQQQQNNHMNKPSTQSLSENRFKVPRNVPLPPHIFQAVKVSPNSEQTFLQRIRQADITLPPARRKLKSKPFVVQRTLPILPKCPSDYQIISNQNYSQTTRDPSINQIIISGHNLQPNNYHIVDNIINCDSDSDKCSNVLSFDSEKQSYFPVINNNNNIVNNIQCNNTFDERQKEDSIPVEFKGGTSISQIIDDLPSLLSFYNENTNGAISSKVSSSILDFSISDSFLDSNNSVIKYDTDPNLSSSEWRTDFLNSLRAASPFKIQAKTVNSANDPQWLSVDEFSLSNFIESSPTKKSDEKNRNDVIDNKEFLVTKLDVDTALHCMMNENSLDYITKFADLAAQVATNSSCTGSQIMTKNSFSNDKIDN